MNQTQPRLLSHTLHRGASPRWSVRMQQLLQRCWLCWFRKQVHHSPRRHRNCFLSICSLMAFRSNAHRRQRPTGRVDRIPDFSIIAVAWSPHWSVFPPNNRLSNHGARSIATSRCRHRLQGKWWCIGLTCGHPNCQWRVRDFRRHRAKLRHNGATTCQACSQWRDSNRHRQPSTSDFDHCSAWKTTKTTCRFFLGQSTWEYKYWIILGQYSYTYFDQMEC